MGLLATWEPLADPKSKLKMLSSKPGILVRPAADNEAKSNPGGADVDGSAGATEAGAVVVVDAGELWSCCGW